MRQLAAAPEWVVGSVHAVTQEGSLLIADDTGGTIWRVSYTAQKDRASDRENTTGGLPR